MQTTLDRFMAKVKVNEATGCWEWQSVLDRYGYGKFYHERNSNYSAHRFAYEFFVQPIADGVCVCHTCDNRCCVNPCHLFQGTVKQNNDDMIAKGRKWIPPKGAAAFDSKLTNKKVQLIKAFFIRHPNKSGRATGGAAFLARWFGVSQQLISLVKNNKRYNHIK